MSSFSSSHHCRSFLLFNSLIAKSIPAGTKNLDSYFLVGTYRVAATKNKFVLVFYIRRNRL